MDDLNDLIYVAAIGAAGSLSGAARALNVNHATVFRRLNKLEQSLGVRLFERGNGRYTPTAAGEEIAATAATIETAAAQSLLKVAGRDLRPAGAVRITTTDSLATALLNPVLKLCRARYPQIELHIDIDNHMRDLSRRDADIAVRPTLSPPQYLVGKRISTLAFAVYGAKAYLKSNRATGWADHQWIALGDAQERHRTVLWLAAHVRLENVGLRVDGFANVARACAEGLGLALLPCFLGDSVKELRRVAPPDASLAADLWVLTHPDLRHTARVKAVFQMLHQELGKLAPRLRGRQ
ncbi:MAG: LysR family transcriptional regulator [Betaproteobacteria bacterium]|nr:LysR family transcriptional regulator [Betaproteobacteria bacterium]